MFLFINNFAFDDFTLAFSTTPRKILRTFLFRQSHFEAVSAQCLTFS